MNSFTGKFSSVRGWALLLALLLGAGMFIPACGDEEVPAPTTPEPAPPAPTPPPEPEPTGPATPENLRVSAVTSSSITWMWDAVEGVLGYQGQFSTDSTFADTDPTFLIVAPNTSHTVSNLAGSTTGHFRVRSGTGTSLTDLQYSEWTDGVSGATDAAPAATALAAPDNLETSDEEEDSIVLTWDAVEGATTYEVQQRDEDATNYSPASCDDAGSVVDDTSCTLTGLDSGTDYDFRVRGIPAADDTANAVGAWGTTSGTTTGRRQTTTTTPGGMGELMVRWHNSGNANSTITFVWDRQGDAMYEIAMLAITGADSANTEVVANVHVENPCRDVNDADSGDEPKYLAVGSSTSRDQPTTAPGTVMGICVREEGSSDASFAWGISPAEEPDTAATMFDNEKDVTVGLEWADVDLKEGFDYEVHLAADPERPSSDNKVGATSRINSRAVQAACEAGNQVDAFTPDIDLTDRTVSVERGLKPYTGYLLCIRASNGAGTGAWSAPIDNDADPGYGTADNETVDEVYTLPASPPSITSAGSETVDATTTENEGLAFAWEIATRNVSNVPRNSSEFTVMAYFQNTPGASTFKVADCGKAAADVEGYDTYTPALTDGLSGFEIETEAANVVRRLAYTRRVYVCARANSTTALTADKGGGMGPWRLSGASTVTKPSTSLSSDAENLTDTGARIVLKGWNPGWSYKTNEDGATCQTVGAGTDDATLSGLSPSTPYRVTAYDECSGDDVGRTLGSTSFRTKATP